MRPAHLRPEFTDAAGHAVGVIVELGGGFERDNFFGGRSGEQQYVILSGAFLNGAGYVLLTPSGVHEVETYEWPDATLGRHKLKTNQPVAGLDLMSVRHASGEEVYGVIGMDVLRSHRVQIDFDSGSLRIFRSLPEDARGAGSDNSDGVDRGRLSVYPDHDQQQDSRADSDRHWRKRERAGIRIIRSDGGNKRYSAAASLS